MYGKRLVVPALIAVSLVACSGDDNGTDAGGSAAQRAALASKFSLAASHAQAAGAFGGGLAFTYASVGALLGAGTTSMNVTSNGLASFRVAGDRPAFATAGAYSVFGIRIRDIYVSGTVADTFFTNAIVAYRDTTDALIAFGEDGESGSFGSEVIGYIFSRPNFEWTATAGTASLTNMSTGSACSIPSQLEAALDDEYGNNWTCNTASFSSTFNATGSEPSSFPEGDTNAATGSRTAQFSGTIPGVFVSVTSNTTARQSRVRR